MHEGPCRRWPLVHSSTVRMIERQRNGTVMRCLWWIGPSCLATNDVHEAQLVVCATLLNTQPTICTAADLELYSNIVRGTLPASWSRMHALRYLHLFENRLNGAGLRTTFRFCGCTLVTCLFRRYFVLDAS